MRFQPALTAAALLALFAGAPASALPPIDFCETNPSSPLCGGDLPIDPVDPCDENPELCEPPDPCEIDPASCEPTDPCVADPASCEPDPEPEPEPEPAPTGQSGELSGSGRVKGEGFKETIALRVALVVNGSTLGLLVDSSCTPLAGQLAPKGKKGDKFQVFLDGPSGGAFADLVALHAARARGAGMGAPLGENVRMVLRRSEDGRLALKLKSEVLFQEGEVIFKANLKGTPAGTPAANPVICE